MASSSAAPIWVVPKFRRATTASVATRLGTVLALGEARVGVVEHVMAALAGRADRRLVVSLDGPEPPILDGDALCYLRLIDEAGIRETDGPGRIFRVLKPVVAEEGRARAALVPSPTRGFDFAIDFRDSAIGAQHFAFEFSPQAFRLEIAPARTFGFVSDLDGLREGGWRAGPRSKTRSPSKTAAS